MEENKHFSHPHNLTLHQTPQGSTTTECSGCKDPASGVVYACSQCKFFLHDQCFKAPRAMAHPSHPLHPLTLVPSPTYPSGSFLCNYCDSIGSGFSYTCSTCDFDLHVYCACISQNDPLEPDRCQNVHIPEPHPNAPNPNIPSDQAQQVQQNQHKSHPKHALKLLSNPPDAIREFLCDGCSDRGSGDRYKCLECDYDLHVKCASLKETVSRADHKHPLTLYHSDPHKGEMAAFECDVCHRNLSLNYWLYCCLECNYGCHVNCVGARERSRQEVELERIMDAQREMSLIQFQTQMHLRTMDTMAASIHYFNSNFY